jgi:hypothetical protein
MAIGIDDHAPFIQTDHHGRDSLNATVSWQCGDGGKSKKRHLNGDVPWEFKGCSMAKLWDLNGD